MYLDKLTNNYAKTCMAAYCGDFDNFIKYFNVNELEEAMIELDIDDIDYYAEFDNVEELYIRDNYGVCKKGELNNLHLLTYMLSYICRHNFIFAYQLRHSNIKLNNLIKQAISSCFIQCGYLEDNFIVENPTLCIWYPKHPSKYICLELIQKHDFYKYSVAHLAVILGWEDIYFKCNLKVAVLSLYRFAQYFKRFKIIKDIKNKNKIIEGTTKFSFKDTVDSELILTGFKIYEPDFDLDYNYNIPVPEYNDNLFLCYNNLEYYYNVPNVQKNIEDKLKLNYLIFKNNIELPRNKKLPFNISNKFIAYIGDIQYYKGGDFEYAKYGALNNSIFANYVLNHQNSFPDFVCKNAVSNMLINNYIKDDLVLKYRPFYLYNYKYFGYRLGEHKFCDMLIDKFPWLEPNINFAISPLFKKINVYNDIDYVYINFIYYYTTFKLYFKNHDIKYLNKHLDFENECNYIHPKKIFFDLSKIDNLIENKITPIFQQESLNITEFISSTQK